jgi:hypothetical protein
MAANIVRDLKSLPERSGPIPPGAKPAIKSFPIPEDPPSAEEVDEFLDFIREIRGKKPLRPKLRK